MESNDLKTALLNKSPVIWYDPVYRMEIEYTVSAVIYRNDNGKIKVTAELKDKCERSFMVVEPEKIRFKEV